MFNSFSTLAAKAVMNGVPSRPLLFLNKSNRCTFQRLPAWLPIAINGELLLNGMDAERRRTLASPYE